MLLAIASNFPSASFGQNLPYCQVSAEQIVAKAKLLEAGIKGDRQALEQYRQLVKTHSLQLSSCRKQSWLNTQATWLRVYPCDLKPGELAQILDNIANFGYNRIYLNVLYDGRILLPMTDNPTVWRSVVGAEAKDADLLAQVITQSKLRGISVHAWVFSMNFGSGYATRTDRQSAIARNGYGETNLQDPSVLPEVQQASHIFVDPYNPQARLDLQTAISAIARRQPDGLAFDYIRYSHRTTGLVDNVRDLMVYGISSGITLLKRAVTQQGQDVIFSYMKDGKVKEQAIASRLWKFPYKLSEGNNLNEQLWELVLAHARLGVVEFLESAALPAKQRNIPTSAVFFPKANLRFGKAVDARLQPWADFTAVSEWAPMLYSLCNGTSCIVDDLTLVMEKSGKKPVCPVFAGYWGQKVGDRPALESQLDALHQAYPQINCASQFAYSWLDLAEDTKRRTCKL